MAKKKEKRKQRPAKSIGKHVKGKEGKLDPEPISEIPYQPYRLAGKVAIITGGDSGIGKAVAYAFGQQGASVVLTYNEDYRDARETSKRLKEMDVPHLILKGDVSSEQHCKDIVKQTIRNFSKIDILINNAAVQFPQKELQKISSKQIQRTFEVNVFGHLYLVKAAEKYLKKGASIIHTTSVTAYRGSHHLIDYAATKGAIVGLLRSLSSYFAEKGIRVNGVAPGPVWTPLIPTTFTPKQVATFGSDSPLGRAAEPYEIATAYVYLGSDESSYITGQVIHPNGGEILNT